MPIFSKPAAAILLALGWLGQAQSPPSLPAVSGTFGSPLTFATHAQFAADNFAWGLSDGQFGAIPGPGGTYTFYGAGGLGSGCAAGSRSTEASFSFTGTLDHLISANGCNALFGRGSGPAGWVFDRDYAGGGKVVPFSSGGHTGYLMAFHGEYHWQNAATPNHQCDVPGNGTVPCFYTGIGLAVSTDNGKTFKVAGQIIQPSQPLSVFVNGGTNMSSGYGLIVVADANGNHLDNPPPDPTSAYFYVFFTDSSPGLPGACATGTCAAVARAKYSDVITAVFSGDPHQVATVFHKYDGASPDPWTQPATSDTPDLSGTAGKFAPLWFDMPGPADVIYDSAFNVYLAVLKLSANLYVRASSDLIHWTGPLGPPYTEAGFEQWYPTLIGETGDPTIGGPAPRVFFSDFAAGKFPDYGTATLVSTPFTLSPNPAPPVATAGSAANGATYVAGGLVPGSWAQVKGYNLAAAARIWNSSDFKGLGNNLPTNLDGVQVKVNNTPAAVYFIGPYQVTFQVPDGISGNASVQVINANGASTTVTGAAVSSAPGLFPNIVKGTNYPAAVFPDGKYVGDPSVNAAYRNAKPGDSVMLFATGLVPEPAGVLPTAQNVSGVTVTVGSTTVPADFAGLVAVGEFQINFTLPQSFANQPAGNYPLSVQVNGVSSPVTIDSNPPGPLVLPISH